MQLCQRICTVALKKNYVGYNIQRSINVLFTVLCLLRRMTETNPSSILFISNRQTGMTLVLRSQTHPLTMRAVGLVNSLLQACATHQDFDVYNRVQSRHETTPWPSCTF